MRKKAKKFFTIAERIHWIWTLLPASVASVVTAILGKMGDFPLMYIWVGIVITFAFVVWALRWMQTPTGKEKEKRDVFYQLCGETYKITEGYTGDKSSFFYALNRAKAVFYDNADVQEVFSRLKKEKGHDSILVPDLLEVMGRSLGIKVDKDSLSTPFSEPQK